MYANARDTATKGRLLAHVSGILCVITCVLCDLSPLSNVCFYHLYFLLVSESCHIYSLSRLFLSPHIFPCQPVYVCMYVCISLFLLYFLTLYLYLFGSLLPSSYMFDHIPYTSYWATVLYLIHHYFYTFLFLFLPASVCIAVALGF